MQETEDHFYKFKFLSGNIKKILRKNLNGILGTVIFHLLILIMFLSFKLHQGMGKQEMIEVKLEAENADDLLKKMDQAEQDKVKQEQKVDQMADGVIRKNIAVDVNQKLEDDISTEKFIQQYADQNKLEGFKRMENPEENKVEPPDTKDATVTENSKPADTEKPPGSNQIYKGPTNIYYDLTGRKVRYLPVPVYTCEGSGKVVVEIYVNPQGQVVSYSILKNLSSINDECLYESASTYASETLFSEDPKAPARQRGILTYVFVAQH